MCMFQAELCHLSCVTLVARFLKGVHFSVTLFNVGSVGAIMLMAMVEMMGQGLQVSEVRQVIHSPICI